MQLKASRHFILENLAGPELFHLPCSTDIWNTGLVCKCNVPQRSLGSMVGGQPNYKYTSLMASSILLLEPFRGLVCKCREHGTLSGTFNGVDKTKFAQVWPRNVCLKICTGIQSLTRVTRKNHLVYESDARLYFVALGLPRRRGRPRLNPDGIVDIVRGVIYDCPVCIGRRHKRHPDHTRNSEPPRLCRQYNEEDGEWTCEACFRVRPIID